MNPIPLRSLPTPALLVDLPVMEANLRRMAHYFRDCPVKLRPHFKNHRVLALASRQIEAGAIGITCARLWQAEALAAHGIGDILIANEIAGEQAVRQLVDLSRRVPVIVAVDDARVVDDMARCARDCGAIVHVVVDMDLGLKRCGVPSAEAALELARRIVRSGGLEFRGLMGYEGHLQPLTPGPDKDMAVTRVMEWLVSARRTIEQAGIPVKIVSCGGTGDYALVGRFPGVTEHQAGAYLLMDRWYAPFAPDFSPALSVLSTVISKTGRQRIVLDAGVKAISGERGLCAVKGDDAMRVTALHAEHALVDIGGSASPIGVGDKLELAVQYHDGTVHLHRRMYGVRAGAVEEVFAIEH